MLMIMILLFFTCSYNNSMLSLVRIHPKKSSTISLKFTNSSSSILFLPLLWGFDKIWICFFILYSQTLSTRIIFLTWGYVSKTFHTKWIEVAFNISILYNSSKYLLLCFDILNIGIQCVVIGSVAQNRSHYFNI